MNNLKINKCHTNIEYNIIFLVHYLPKSTTNDFFNFFFRICNLFWLRHCA
jgi:hypothetical protein